MSCLDAAFTTVTGHNQTEREASWRNQIEENAGDWQV
jgi:hypothetical protein